MGGMVVFLQWDGTGTAKVKAVGSTTTLVGGVHGLAFLDAYVAEPDARQPLVAIARSPLLAIFYIIFFL